MNIKQTIQTIRDLGLTCRCHDGEWRINFFGGNEDTAYYTDDAEDAVDTAKAMLGRGPDERYCGEA